MLALKKEDIIPNKVPSSGPKDIPVKTEPKNIKFGTVSKYKNLLKIDSCKTHVITAIIKIKKYL